MEHHDYCGKQALGSSQYSPITHTDTHCREIYLLNPTTSCLFLQEGHQIFSICGATAQTEVMFIKNDKLRCRHHRHEVFLPSRPYRGEPPTVAGFLLYPDTPAKMETTSQVAFCKRTLPQQSGGKGVDVWSSHQEPYQSHPTVTGQRGVGNSEQGEDEENHNKMQSTAVTVDRETLQMQSQYQKDFPPPSSSTRRRTPALPQPDNIGINPAFRFEFSTVNMVDYPHWSIINPGCTSRQRATVPRKLNSTSES